MSTTTPRLILVKPADPEAADIAVLNANFDKIDNNFVPAAKIRIGSGTQPVANITSEKVTFNNTMYDSYAGRPEGDMADLTNDRIFARKTGLYIVSSALFYGPNVNGYRSLDLRHNGAQIKLLSRDADTQSGAGTSLSHTQDLFMTAGDYVELWTNQTSGGSLSLQSVGAGSETTVLSLRHVGNLT